MEPQTHPDPFTDAASHGIHRIIQIASSAATGVQVFAYVRQKQARALAQQDQHDYRALTAQVRAEQAAARAGLASLHDPRWLMSADLRETARAWGAVMPFTDPATSWYDLSAVTARRYAEERLRVLHPTAMARYDRLRSDGLPPAEAMRQAAPMFGYPPRAHNPPYTPPPPSLSAGTATTAAKPGPEAGHIQAASPRPPWQQDFPAPIDEVLAATTNKDSSAPPSPAKAATRRRKPAHRK